MSDLIFNIITDSLIYIAVFFSLGKVLIFRYNKVVSYLAIVFLLVLPNIFISAPFVDYAIENNFNYLINILIFLFILGLVLYFLIMLKDKIRYRIIIAITYLSLITLNTLVDSILGTLLFNYSYEYTQKGLSFNTENTVLLILSVILTFIVSSLVSWFFKKVKSKISNIYLLVVPFIIISELFLISICFNSYRYNINLMNFYPNIKYAFITTIFVTISNFVLLYLLAKVVDKTETEEKYSSLELEHKLQFEAINKINLANDKEKQFNHDMKNQLYTIDILLKNNDSTEALNITKKLLNNLKSLKSEMNTQ